MRTKVVELPRQLNAAAGYALISKVIDPEGRPFAECVKILFARLNFIEADGVVTLSNIIKLLEQRGVNVEFIIDSKQSRANIYLDSFGFFELFTGNKLSNQAQRETTMCLTVLSHDNSYAWLTFELIPWLSAKLEMPGGVFSDIKTCFQEIFNNVRDHSREDLACVHVQWHPNIHQIRAAISDFGIGIPAAMAERYPQLSDPEAIKRATEHGITSKVDGRNLGAGLDILIQNVVGLNQGKLVIRSNGGVCRCVRDGAQVRRTADRAPGFYPGTLVDITLRTDTFVHEGADREDLEWI